MCFPCILALLEVIAKSAHFETAFLRGLGLPRTFGLDPQHARRHPRKSASSTNQCSTNIRPNPTARTTTDAQSSNLSAVQVSLPSTAALTPMCKVIGGRPHHKNLHGWTCCETKMEDKKYTREYSPESNKKGSSQHFTVQACLKWRCRTRPACFLVPDSTSLTHTTETIVQKFSIHTFL